MRYFVVFLVLWLLGCTLLSLLVCHEVRATTVIRLNSEQVCFGPKRAYNICVSEEGVEVKRNPFSSGLRRSRPGYVRPDTLPPIYRDYRGGGLQ